jgi:hypothetical protein
MRLAPILLLALLLTASAPLAQHAIPFESAAAGGGASAADGFLSGQWAHYDRALSDDGDLSQQWGAELDLATLAPEVRIQLEMHLRLAEHAAQAGDEQEARS